MLWPAANANGRPIVISAISDRPIARVVVAFDAVGEHQSSAETAAQLANWLDAALYGIFIEDDALLRLAGLPFARHIGASGKGLETFEEETLLHQFKAHAARARTAIEAAAIAEKVDWSFDVIRGSIAIASGALGDHDLLVVEAASRPFAGGMRLDSRLLDAAIATGRPLLVIRDGSSPVKSVVVLVVDDGALSKAAIATAAGIAAASGRALGVFVADGYLSSAEIRALVGGTSEKLARGCLIETFSDRDQTLARQARRGDLLVVAIDPNADPAAALRDVLAKTQADVYFLR